MDIRGGFKSLSSKIVQESQYFYILQSKIELATCFLTTKILKSSLFVFG